MSDILVSIIERYFNRLRDERGLGGGTKERSFYPVLADLLNGVGDSLKPKVLCLSDLANTGAGHPDFGLYAASQVQKGEPRKGQAPERGVIEVKSLGDDAWLTAETAQVSKYFGAYRLVIVTNIRDFLIIGEGLDGKAARLESFRLAPDAAAFWDMVATPKKSAQRIGQAFGEYLRRALTQSVALREPKDVAWFLASYARDALGRVDAAGDLPALKTVRSSLEDALGVMFEAEKGEHFFRSTLVQTLFYGVFSAWALWAREVPRPTAQFEWRNAVWHLNVPFVRELFRQLSDPASLRALNLVEVLNWTAATLNRVDPSEFFKRFNDADAVQFFYEPFLEAFDPALRKELGVWYTPSEVVSYMVERVDKALRDDLGVADGLASEQVIILDPCCGTGAYLAAVLRKIDASLDAKGFGALKGQMVKKAALERVFGFEIMPAPLVVAHLQVGLVLSELKAGLDAEHERAGIFLTNALTGWEPHVNKPLPFPELEEERRRADKVKQEARILVIIGNPPYNGYAGMAVSEERELSNAYRSVKKVRRPEGQGLNDLYIRFFRMAERRIVDKTGQGVIAFISNYSWLDGLSFTGMRERFLEAFDAIRIDSLNGDKYKTGKTTPEGRPDPSIFSTGHNREGIQVGTAVVTLVRKNAHVPVKAVELRQVWGNTKRAQLTESAGAVPAAIYGTVTPPLELGLPFVAAAVGAGYFGWPKLPELLPVSFPGVTTARDDFLVSIDRESLERRLSDYFDTKMTHDDVRVRYPVVMRPSARFDPLATRDTLSKRGVLSAHVVRYAYRPFDIRWIYWEPETKLLDEKRSEYWPHLVAGNRWLTVTESIRKGVDEPQYLVSTALGSYHLIESGSNQFAEYLTDFGGRATKPNLSQYVAGLIGNLGLPHSCVFEHVVSILNAPAYRLENSDVLAKDWPRIPLPSAAATLAASATLGATLAILLDPEIPAPGISTGTLRPLMRTLALPTVRENKPMDDAIRSLTAGWGSTQNAGGGSIVMPGRGSVTERDYTAAELSALATEAAAQKLSLETALALLGQKTFDIHLNDNACWSNVPANVWAYTLGGYQVMKKWLSYRERSVLGRALTADEVAYASEIPRRIAAILLMGPALDANYAAARAGAVEWKEGRPVEPAITAVTDG